MTQIAPLASSFCSSFLSVPTAAPTVFRTTTVSSTATITPPPVVVEEIELTETTTTTTTTVTATPPPTPGPLRKRQAASLSQLRELAQNVLSSACSCFITTPAAATRTSTVSVIAGTVTLGASTITSTGFDVTTALVTATATATAAASIVNFSKVSGGRLDCTYNRYYEFPLESNDIAVGVQNCARRCAADARCKFWWYMRFDPVLARGADYGACGLDDQPYDPALVQCNYPTLFYVAYNKV